jgi:hypothetical protein
MRSAFFACATAWVVLMMAPRISTAKDEVAGNLIQFNENGAWCWYQDPRMVVDPANDTLLVSSIGAAEGLDGDNRSGDVDVVTYQFATGQATRSVLRHHFLPQDDHNAAALLIRPDGRYLAMYALHNHENNSYWRISTNPHDASDWGPERTFDWSSQIEAAGAHSHVTYSNLYYLSAEGKTYNFSRAINDDPSILISSDNGDRWSYAAKLLTEEKLGYVNGYTRYVSNGVDRIDFITTEHHPRDFNNSIYHGYIQGGKLHRSDGSIVDDDVFHSAGHEQTELTKVFAAGSTFGGTTMTHAWTVQAALDPSGNPCGLISCRANDEPENTNFEDHRFFYARYDGKTWQVNQLAKAGARLWEAEQDYTGLATFDPLDPSIVYISTTIDPRDDSKLNAHEIFRGITKDFGKTWNWIAITSNSTIDNLRPLAVAQGDSTVLVWFRGTMTRSQHYDCAMVGTILGKNQEAAKVQYLARTTALPKLDSGSYNVFAYFWSDTSGNDRISAGLKGANLMEFRSRSCQAAEASQFAQPPEVTNGNRLLYRAFLGRMNGGLAQPVEVSVQDNPTAPLFAGLGYQKAD